MSRRTDRIASLIRSQLGEVILQKLKDPRIGFVTITVVDVTPDLKSAKVFFSVMGDKKKKEQTRHGLEHSAGFLQHEIAAALKLRYTPKLFFELDESIDHEIQIGKILHDLEKEKTS